MVISNPQTFDHLKAASGETLRIKLVPIGDWDMDTTANKNVAHGLDDEKIIAAWACIRNDTGFTRGNLAGMYQDPYPGYGGIVEWGGVSIYLWRTERGHYDSIDYNTVPLNRGTITILYHD